MDRVQREIFLYVFDFFFTNLYINNSVFSLQVKSNQSWIEQVLKQHKISFSFVDVAADEDALKYMKRKNRGEKELPQIFVDGEYKGVKYFF